MGSSSGGAESVAFYCGFEIGKRAGRVKASAGDGEENGHDELGNEVTNPAWLARCCLLVPETSPTCPSPPSPAGWLGPAEAAPDSGGLRVHPGVITDSVMA